MDDKTLDAIFVAVGKRYGYDDVSAHFTEFRDFKIKWSRTYKWISLEVSDYLKDAPEKVVESLASTLFKRITEDGENTDYSKQVVEWLGSDDFVRRNQPLYIRRFRTLTRSSTGHVHDLRESYERLIDMGLVKRDPLLYLEWADKTRSRKVGTVSVLLKVVAMSSNLDDEDIPQDVLDYCVYSQVAHVGMGFNEKGTRRGAEYDALLSLYPGRKDVEKALIRKGLYV